MESLKDEEAKNSKRRKVGKTKSRKDNHVKMTIKSKRLNVEKKERRNVGKRIVGKTGNRTKH